MASVDNAPLPEDAPPNAVEHQKRIPLVWIPATLGVGLVIAAVYLGGRIVTAHPHAKADAAPVAQTIPAVQPAPAVVEPKPANSDLPPAAPRGTPPETETAVVSESPVPVAQALPSVASDDGFPMIAPQAGERYIQVGALDLGAEATRRFVQRLRKENLDPHVAPGPKPALMRVLIGPFDKADPLSEKKAQIESEGIATFVRQY